MSLLKRIILTKFAITSANKAASIIRSETEKTLAIAESLGDEGCAKSVTVSKMPGVDEDMRAWSIYQLAEHNAIVNRRMTMVVRHLAEGEALPDDNFNPKTDVMPTELPGKEALDEFKRSSDEHLEAIAKLVPLNLKKTPAKTHPIFGDLTAHGWHCICGFHLMLHRKQATAIAKAI